MIKHGDTVVIEGRKARVFMECDGSDYPYAVEQINGHDGVWVNVQPWEMEPYNSDGESMCGKYKAVRS